MDKWLPPSNNAEYAVKTIVYKDTAIALYQSTITKACSQLMILGGNLIWSYKFSSNYNDLEYPNF